MNKGVFWGPLNSKTYSSALLLGWKSLLFILVWSGLIQEPGKLRLEVAISLIWFCSEPQIK